VWRAVSGVGPNYIIKLTYVYVIDIERFNEKNPERVLCSTDVGSDKKDN
jgi:hypothetical protein